MFSISTAWMREKSLDEFVSDIKEIGFRSVELSVRLDKKTLDNLLVLLRRNSMSVVSVHNFCPLIEPLPEGVSVYNPFLLSSDDEEETAKAVSYTMKTIELASSVGAKAVVVHTGTVPVSVNSKELVKLYNKSGALNGEFEKLKVILMRERKEKIERYLNNSINSLNKIKEFAAKKRIAIGLENRYYPEEIPNIDDFNIIFNRFLKDSIIGYWHDVGHAEVLDRLGFTPHFKLLELCCERIVGVHIHDVIGLSDHKAPGTGSFDFSRLIPYIKSQKNILLVFEPHFHVSKEELKNAFSILSNVLDIY